MTEKSWVILTRELKRVSHELSLFVCLIKMCAGIVMEGLVRLFHISGTWMSRGRGK